MARPGAMARASRNISYVWNEDKQQSSSPGSERIFPVSFLYESDIRAFFIAGDRAGLVGPAVRRLSSFHPMETDQYGYGAYHLYPGCGMAGAKDRDHPPQGGCGHAVCAGRWPAQG